MFMASSSSSPAAAQVMKYDVFLSFSGEDTLNNFTSHIFGVLSRKNIDTFIDNQLIRGDETSPSLLNAIKESTISVIIFSKNYAASRRCLQELEQIMDCMRTNGQIVIPVFYHVDTFDVRKQKCEFGDAFAKLQERFHERSSDQLKRWKAALEEAASLSGYHIDDKKTENKFIKIIVDDISKRLGCLPSSCHEDLVGVQSSSPATPQVMKHDVFVSFRGQDTRGNITSRLYGALDGKKINTFIDDEVSRGDEIPSLLNAIEASKISIIIFSENYAASTWCLQELEQILDCGRSNQQIVIPVFYKVDPEDVRHQKGKFGDAFAKLEDRFHDRSDQLKRWKDALKEAANLPGYHIDGKKTANKFINSIVDDISKRLGYLPSSDHEDLVGVQSSSPTTPQVMKHNVFLSFRGEDTRNNFTSHLYGALCREKIETYIDNELSRGDEISTSLLNAIKASNISVIIFSRNYAASRWCLKELEQILDCRTTNGQIVIPVFYHVDPLDVRKQIGEFGKAFAKLQGRFEERSSDQLERWKAALKEAANLSGYHIDEKKSENQFINIIVNDISKSLGYLPSSDHKDLVGVQSSSPTIPQVMKHNVFLSFRGEDTRNNFTSHLYGALCREKIETYIDNELSRGDEISLSLLNAIKASNISVIIFSRNYAASRWCLKELEQILDCRTTNGQIVIPVFYHVDPFDVRKQIGKFGKAFAKFQGRFEERSSDHLKRWKAALEEAANLSGYHIDEKKPEHEYIEIIVDDILRKLGNVYSTYDKDLIGVQFSIEKVKSLLQIGSNGVHIIGIWGIGGVGKTTIASVVFNQILHLFEGFYFVANVREEWEKSPGLDHLQKELLNAILDNKHFHKGLSPTKKMLRSRKILVIFDDVTHSEQIEKLIGDFNDLGPGSRIIITTRDKHVLKNCGVNDSNIFKVEGLCDEDALQLFCTHAFGQICSPEDFRQLSNKYVTYAKGVPLALKVFGQSLFGKSRHEWMSKLNKLEKFHDKDILNVLKTSYDGLDYEEKNIFLDIACFSKGLETSLMEDILDTNDFSTQIVLSCLIDKCLITVSDGIIIMHDLLQEMGKEIVRQESDDPGKRSRLWHHEDIYNVLRKKKGKNEIQGICVDLSKINSIKLDPYAFSKMYNLRFFILYDSGCDFWEITDDQTKLQGFEQLQFFSTKFFSWENYPFRSLSTNFQVENLVRLDMPNSNVEQLWNGDKDLVNLKHIDLSYCKHLKEVPDFSKAVNLQELNLRECRSLTYIPGKIQSKCLSLSGCSALKVAPRISCKVEKLDLSGTAIEESPFIEDQSRLVRLDLSNCLCLESISSNICECKYLEYLSVNNCSKLERLPEDLGNLKALKTLVASGIGLREVPSSILNLNELSLLALSRNSKQGPLNWSLHSLSDLRSLVYLGLANCQLVQMSDNLCQLSSLRKLNLLGNNFESIPASIKDLFYLCYLNISYCKRLVSIPMLPRGVNVDACSCSSVKSISELPFRVLPMLRRQRINLAKCDNLDMSEILRKESGQKIFNNVCYSGNQIPDWFHFKDEGSEIYQKIRQHWINEEVLGFNMCLVVEIGGYHVIRPQIRCSYNITGRVINKTEVYECTLYGESKSSWPAMADYGGSHYVLMDFVPILNKYIHGMKYEKYTENNYTLADMGFFASDLKIKKCGAHLVCASECEDTTHSSGDLMVSEEFLSRPKISNLLSRQLRYKSYEGELEEEEESYDDELQEEDEESFYLESLLSRSRLDEEEEKRNQRKNKNLVEVSNSDGGREEELHS